MSERPVLETSQRWVDRYLDLRLEAPEGGEAQHLGVTPEHPFHTAEGWKAAGDLRRGDTVLARHAGWLRVAGATWVQEKAAVFNLEVAGDHTYAAGRLGAWVHNGYGGKERAHREKTRGANRADGKMVDDAARQAGVKDRKGFGKFLHEAKDQERRGASDNYTYTELMELAKEWLAMGGR